MSIKAERRVVQGRGVRIPKIQLRSPHVGPSVTIAANLHGDECTGIAVVHSLVDILSDRLKAGSVQLFPSLNPEGMTAGKRGFPGDALDPNRATMGPQESLSATVFL